MATAGLTQYQQLVEAVGNYYGVGSDQWVEIAKYGLNADNCANILSQTPGVEVITSNSGKVLGYTVEDVFSTSAQGAAAAINSNTQVATMASKTAAKLPANMTVDGTGKVVAESGLKTVSSGSTVTATLGKVAVGVGAVAAGIQLGAAIDGALYNANPDFWDSQGMGAINPQTWDSICSTQGGKDVFNMVFGIDKDTGETQAYMQQEAFAQIAQYLADKGAFNSMIVNDVISYPNYTVNSPLYSYDIPTTGSTIEDLESDGLLVGVSDRGHRFYLGATSLCKICETVHDGLAYVCFASDTPCTVYRGVRYSWGRSDVYTHYIDVKKTIDGHTFYLDRRGLFPTDYDFIYNSAAQSNSISTDANLCGLFMLFGNTYTHTVGQVDGISHQEGATLPQSITPEMTTTQVIALLQQLYPNLFDRAITNEVVQPDGSVKTFTYVPVGFPDEVTKPTPTSELQPTGGTGTSQANDTISETSPENTLQTFLDIFSTPDPYEPTEKPNPNDYPDTGDGVTPTPVIPSGSASALYSIYNPSQAELNSFGAWLWSNDFVDQLKKIFNDPMQAIIGLHKVFATPATSGSGTIKVGYLNSGVSANLVSNQYSLIDCGTVNLYEYFGNVLDYTQTEVYLYLPFVGIVRVNVDDVMRSAINIVYKVDVLTGACLCSVNVTRDLSGGQLYTYSGNCAVQYPLSSGSYMGIVSSALGIAGSVVGTIASGGALLPMALGVGAGALASAKTHVEHSGSLTGNAGAMGIKTPYIIVKRPQTKIAEGFKNFNGIAENKTVKINTLSGFVKAKHTKLSNIAGATQSDYAEIERLLKEGVFI